MGGAGQGRMSQESGTDMHTTTRETDRQLQGSCRLAQGAQLCALEGWGEGWEGGPRERGRVYIYIADSRLCTAETNTTL